MTTRVTTRDSKRIVTPRILQDMYKSAPIKPGTRVKVTQQMPTPDGAWTTTIRGTVQRWRQATTGSWFAHSKDDRLWLDRLEVRLDDGETTVLNLDQYSLVEAI